MKVYAIENHPADSRVTIADDVIVQTLSARCGTGGGNTPMVLMVIEGTNSNARYHEEDISPTVIARAGTCGGNAPLVLLKETRRTDESISRDHGSVMCKQPSRQLHGAGCVQQHASGDREEQP